METKLKQSGDDVKSINFSKLKIEQIDGTFKDGGLTEKERKAFANHVYYNTNDIGEAEIARRLYKSDTLELPQNEIPSFQSVMEKFGKTFFTAIAQKAINKLINDENNQE